MESQVILSRLSFDDDDSGLGMDFEEYTNKDQNVRTCCLFHMKDTCIIYVSVSRLFK